MMDFNDHLSSVLADDSRRRRYMQNSAIVDAALALNKALESAGKTQRELAIRLNRSEGFVSQVLSGGGNLTLKTLGDFAWGLDCSLEISLCQQEIGFGSVTETWSNSPTLAPPKAADTQLALAA